jgi:ABC-type transporter Mla MlaB component
MIRITRTSDAHRTVLQIEGRLRSPDVAELVREFQTVEGPAVLELSNLQSADSAGVEILLELTALGAEIRGVPPYLELLLKMKS